MKEDKKGSSEAEAVAEWLGRETGHTDAPEAGYADNEGMNLPVKRQKDLGQFFDSLHMDQLMRDKRKQKMAEALDNAEALRGAIQPAPAPEGMMNNVTSY